MAEPSRAAPRQRQGLVFVWVLHSQRSVRPGSTTSDGGGLVLQPVQWPDPSSLACSEIVRSWTGHRDVTGLRVDGRAEAHHGMFHVERCSETHAVARTITHAGRSERLVDEHQVPA
jgi:hypothetical protein